MSGTRSAQVRFQDPAVIADVLARMRASAQDIAGAVVASRDGLVVAANIDPAVEAAAREAEPANASGRFVVEDTAAKTAAMASVAAGLGAQFVRSAGTGQFQAVTFEGSAGCVGVFPLTSALLLVLLGGPKVTMGRFVVAAKHALSVMHGPQQD
jgi:predicted regulator of Ras-like GTPase activity (Roadblock/LC7/MglB family)